VRLKLNGAHQLLGDNRDNKENTETLIDVSQEVGLVVNTDKTMYMILSRHQNAGQNHDIKIARRSVENMALFKYLGTTVTNQNLIKEEIMRPNSGNACYYLVQNISSSRLLSKKVKIRYTKL
jgi:xylose isomerase